MIQPKPDSLISNIKLTKASYMVKGAAIRILRENMNWTIAELVKKTGISQTTLNKIEKGKSLVSLIVIRKLADVFLLTPEELIAEIKNATTQA